MKKIAFLICSAIAFCLLSNLLGCSGDGGGGDGSGQPPVNPVTHSVSGTIFAANNSVIDSDVNDSFAEYNSNDSFVDAQTVPNPAILGGYVNIPGTGWVGENGEVGRSYISGDLKDFFSVTLTTNQSINLYIADFSDSQPDLDLTLYDENEVMVDSSIGTDQTETVSPSESGDYFIEVSAISGASNYILVIGQPITAATILDPRMDEDFMPGHVIVAFHEESTTIQSGSKMLSQATYRGMSHKEMVHGSIRLYQFTDHDKQQVFQELRISPAETNRALYLTNDPDEQLKLDTLRVIDALSTDPNVRFAEPNYFRYPLFVPNDPDYSKQWHYPLINMPLAWEITKGQDVIVAVIDTGILSQHPDIIGQLTTDGYDFISLDSIANDTDPGRDDDPEDTGDEMTGGSSFHGTHVSGTIAAASNNAVGVAGIAYRSKIMPLRALGVGGGLSTDIMEAMKYAAGLDNNSNALPDKPADIINMSLGGGGFSQADQEIIDDVRAAGVIIIAAAGNEDTSEPSYPAAYTGVVSVSAVGPDKSLASYSNYGDTIDVAAPGGDFTASGDGVYSTSGDDGSQGGTTEYVYSYSRGTSMASPHMAGVVALMKSVQPALTPIDLDGLINAGTITEDLGADGASVRNDSFGYGLIDAFKAVEAVSGPLPAYLLADPVSLNFGNITTQQTVTLTKSNSNALTVDNVVEDADWLTVTADPGVDADGIGDYLVAVDRTGLVDGPYYTTITFESSENSVDVLVIMYQGPVSVVGDSGFHYVLLLDATTLRPMYQDSVGVSNGEYAYDFPSVAEGNYIVFAGTDSDNDLYIGDSGEATGAFISLDQPAIIEVDQDLSDIDFNTAFNINISADHLAADFRSTSGFRRWAAE